MATEQQDDAGPVVGPLAGTAAGTAAGGPAGGPDGGLDAGQRRWRGASDRLRWRVRGRRAIEALALAATLALGGIVLALLWMDAGRFEVLAVQAGREAAAGVLVLAAVVLLGLLLRGLSRRRLADRLERADARFDGLLLSAAEVDAGVSGEVRSAGLTARLYRRAASALEAGSAWHIDEARRRRRAAGALAVPLLLALGLWGAGPEWLQHGLRLLLAGPAGLPAAIAANPYRLQVTPGDVQVLEGEDLLVSAIAENFAPASMTLRLREVDGDAWQRLDMRAEDAAGAHQHLLVGLGADLEYQVEAQGLSSAVHRVEVIARPRLAGIELTYRYPAHTGAAPRQVADGGDISAVRGTRVTVRVRGEGDVAAAQLDLGSGALLPLRAEDGAEGGVWVGSFELQTDDSYRVALASPRGGGLHAVSRDYAITVLDDGLPQVVVASPGRDTKVTAIEEAVIRVDARDDVALRGVELVLSVNGEDELVVPLGAAAGPTPGGSAVVEAAHTLYLEDIALEPGDLIAYHARARDSDQAERSVQSDIYFLEVRPFERHYRRAGGGGGGGGGGGQGGEDAMLAAQQKSLVVALFKMVRDRDRLDDDLFAEQVGTLGEAQTRIRGRVDAIARRLGERRLLDMEPGYRRMAEELPLAAAAMLTVEAQLAIRDIASALPEAREALRHLQRADAAFREVQVAQAQRGGGGGGQAAQASDLANLFRLEMDRFRSQYSHVQRQRPGGAQAAALDETMRKLEELARRQERELRQAAAQASAEDAGGGGGNQAALAADVERLLRELQRLTRERPDPRVQQSIDRLREAAQAMREGGQGGGEGARNALDRLREAQRLLDEAQPAQLADTVRRARDRARALRETHEQVQRDLRGLQGGGEIASAGGGQRQSGRQSGSQSGSQSGAQAGRQDGNQSGGQSGGQSANQSGAQASSQASGQPGGQSGGQAGGQSGGLAGGQAGGQAGGAAAGQPGGQGAGGTASGRRAARPGADLPGAAAGSTAEQAVAAAGADQGSEASPGTAQADAGATPADAQGEAAAGGRDPEASATDAVAAAQAEASQDPEALRRRVVEGKVRMQAEVEALESELGGASRQVDADDVPLRNALADAAGALRGADVNRELQRTAVAVSRGREPESHADAEARIGQALGEAERSLERAVAVAGDDAAGRAARARERLARATRQLADVRDRLDGHQTGAEASGQQAGQGDGAQGAAGAQADAGAQAAAGTQGGAAGGSRGGDGEATQGGSPGTAGDGTLRGNSGGGAGDGVAMSGGRWGGAWAGRGNADFDGVRQGLQGTLESLREALSAVAPGSVEAQDIEQVVRGLEDVLAAGGGPQREAFTALLATLQGIERSLREADARQPAALAAAERGTVPAAYQNLVEAYFRRLSEMDLR